MHEHPVEWQLYRECYQLLDDVKFIRPHNTVKMNASERLNRSGAAVTISYVTDTEQFTVDIIFVFLHH